MRNFLQKIKGVGLAAMAVITGLALGASAHAADIDTGFDATSTQTMLTTLFGNMSPTLKIGIIAVVGTGLGVWVIFFLIGKLKKTVR